MQGGKASESHWGIFKAFPSYDFLLQSAQWPSKTKFLSASSCQSSRMWLQLSLKWNPRSSNISYAKIYYSNYKGIWEKKKICEMQDFHLQRMSFNNCRHTHKNHHRGATSAIKHVSKYDWSSSFSHPNFQLTAEPQCRILKNISYQPQWCHL